MSARAIPTKPMVYSTIALLMSWLPAKCADVQNSQIHENAKVERIDVLDYGIYTADKTTSEISDAGLTHNTVNNIQYIASTDTIPAQVGIKFGFRYILGGEPDGGRVRIKQVTIYPTAGITNPKTGLLYTHSFTATYGIGPRPIFAGYDIDAPWEMVPGVWTIQLWVGEKKLAEQNFTVVEKKDGGPDQP